MRRHPVAPTNRSPAVFLESCNASERVTLRILQRDWFELPVEDFTRSLPQKLLGRWTVVCERILGRSPVEPHGRTD